MQCDVTKKLSQRIGDVTYWKNEAQNEMDKMTSEIEALTKSKCCLERALAETDNLIHIAQECLYYREKRQGIDQVHDDVENSLILVSRRSIKSVWSTSFFVREYFKQTNKVVLLVRRYPKGVYICICLRQDAKKAKDTLVVLY